MAATPPLCALSAKLGRDLPDDLLSEALTHPSAGSPARPDYQRLEFLGDRVLALVMAETLMARFPDAAEGELAPRLNAMVRRETCAEAAEGVGLGAYLRLDRSESRSGGRRRLSILADAMEAVIAAIYRAHGLEAARETILRLWAPMLARLAEDAPREPKSALQEWAEGRGLEKPVYDLVARAGPDHKPRFTVEARLADGRAARAEGDSKREAEKRAAAALLKEIEHG